MITPAFFGLYNASRGLSAAQAGLNVVNSNISNANTPGYSRQVVNLESVFPYSFPMINRNNGNDGQIGQGVEVASITRARDSLLDIQYRTENSTSGKLDTTANLLGQVESILGEPSDNGVNATMQAFFNAAQTMSLHPDDLAIRTNFIRAAQDMVGVFQQQANSLNQFRAQLVGDPSVSGSVATSQLSVHVDTVNNILANIGDLNKQIVTVVSTGAQPNDLYDKRDKLLDDLSKLVDFTLTNQASGQIDLSIGGQKMIQGINVVNTLQLVTNPGPSPTAIDVPSLIQTVTGSTTINDNITGGQIRGLLDVGGNVATQTTIRGTLEKLNTLLTSVATQVNALQTGAGSGRDLSGALPSQPIFSLAAGSTLNIFRYSVNSTVVADPTLIAAAANDPGASGPPAGFAGVGDGRNALAMAQLQNGTFAALGNVGFANYFGNMVSTVGVDTQSAQSKNENQTSVLTSLDQRRQAVSGVNVDEEMVDMLKFQRAFEASSKIISIFDKVYQTLINIV